VRAVLAGSPFRGFGGKYRTDTNHRLPPRK
jgi:hypothetical protein